MNPIRLIFISLALLISIFCQAQTVNESVAFEEKIHDFGEISETGGKVTYRFRFTNTGSQPVVMLRARAGCSCVSAQVPSKPVEPGKSDYVTVTFDPNYRPGHFSKEIVVYSGDRQYNRIWVKGDVKAGKHDLSENYRYELGSGLRADYKVMNFGHVTPQLTTTKVLRLANDSADTMRLDFETDASGVSAKAGCLLYPGSEASVEIVVRPTEASSDTKTVRLYPVSAGKRLQPIDIVFIPSR